MDVTAWDLVLNLRRGDASRAELPHTFEGTMILQGDDFGLQGIIKGEAVYSSGIWFLRGSTSFELESDQSYLNGGFALDLYVGSPQILDDRVVWRFDGFG